jgi:hypothetical protein
MKQFQFQDWADYVRGVASPHRKTAMDQAIQDADPESLQLLHLATQAHEAARFLAPGDVPASVLTKAINLFDRTLYSALPSVPLASIRLQFDSLLDPHPIGFRSTGTLHRETTHIADEFQLSLNLQQESGTELLTVVGQITTDPSTPSASVSTRPIFIYQREKLVARTLSSDSGEFQMEFLGREPLKLVVLIDNPDRRIELDLVPESGKKLKRG